MMALVRSAALAGFKQKLEKDGVKPTDLFGQLALPLNLLDDPDELISQQLKVRLLEQAAAMTGHPNWGLELGYQQNVAMLGSIGVLLQQSENVREALELIGRSLHRQAQHVEFMLIETGDAALLRFRYMEPVSRHSRQANDMAIGITYSALNFLCGRKVPLRAVEFTHPQSEYTADLQWLFDTRLFFGNDYCGLLLDRSYLDMPVAGRSIEIQRMVQSFLQTKYPNDLPGQVCWVLGNMLPLEAISLNLVATSMGMSARTLQRRLLENDVAFKTLLDTVRVNLVCLYLREGRLNLTHIAQMVGYAHQSALSRSFKRIKGITPSQWLSLEREQVSQALS
ncbi:AraC family transcriptional regulator [Endozoicomonadaceae bacterium StTr2]